MPPDQAFLPVLKRLRVDTSSPRGTRREGRVFSKTRSPVEETNPKAGKRSLMAPPQASAAGAASPRAPVVNLRVLMKGQAANLPASVRHGGLSVGSSRAVTPLTMADEEPLLELPPPVWPPTPAVGSHQFFPSDPSTAQAPPARGGPMEEVVAAPQQHERARGHEWYQSLTVGTIYSLVFGLRFEDPRLPSPRISLLEEVFRLCPHLRLRILEAVTQTSFEWMSTMREATQSCVGAERDLQAVMSRDHGAGLAELLNAMVSFVRADLGVASPLPCPDDDDLASLLDDSSDEDDLSDEEEDMEEDEEEEQGGGAEEAKLGSSSSSSSSCCCMRDEQGRSPPSPSHTEEEPAADAMRVDDDHHHHRPAAGGQGRSHPWLHRLCGQRQQLGGAQEEGPLLEQQHCPPPSPPSATQPPPPFVPLYQPINIAAPLAPFLQPRGLPPLPYTMMRHTSSSSSSSAPPLPPPPSPPLEALPAQVEDEASAAATPCRHPQPSSCMASSSFPPPHRSSHGLAVMTAPPGAAHVSPPPTLPAAATHPSLRWADNAPLVSEGVKALGLLLRGHACKLNSPSTDKAEALHLRECVIEMISAYPPTAIKVVEMVLQVWPSGNSTRESSFLQLLTLVLSCSPLSVFHSDEARTHVKAFRRVVRCIKSAHAGVAEEALLACSNPRIIARYMTPQEGHDPGTGTIHGMVCSALRENQASHWHPDIRGQCRKLADVLEEACGAATAMG